MIPGSDVIRSAVPPHELAHDRLNQVSQLETCLYLRNTLLRDADVCSMANSLELRVPLLDHRLVECVAPLPGSLKKAREAPKQLLVDAMQGSLPPEIWRRRKQGFVIPYERWIRGALRSHFDTVLQDADRARAIGLRPERVKQVWQQFLSGYRGLNMQHPLALYALMRWCGRHRVSC
jgi:asparagine synthase (glutamine-hydrolysing)